MRPDLVILCPRNRNKEVCNVATAAALPGVEKITPYNPQSVDVHLNKGNVGDIVRDKNSRIWLVIEFTAVRDYKIDVSTGIGIIEEEIRARIQQDFSVSTGVVQEVVRANVQAILLMDKKWAWRQKLLFYDSFLTDPDFDDEEGPQECFKHVEKYMPYYPLVVTDGDHIEGDLTRKLTEMQKGHFGRGDMVSLLARG